MSETQAKVNVMPEPMRIDTPPGSIVHLTRPDHGWDHDKRQINDLKMWSGDFFTVERTEIHSSGTSLYLKEFPGKEFNTVNFSNAEAAACVNDDLLAACKLLVHNESKADELSKSGMVDNCHMKSLRASADAARAAIAKAKVQP